MTSRNLPAGILQKLTRQRRNRSLRQFRPVVLGMEQRVLLTTYMVGSGTTEYPTIQSAITAAGDGDTIMVDPGTYTDPVSVNKQLTIEGAGQTTAVKGLTTDDATTQSVLDFSGQGGGVLITSSGVTLEGFDIKGDASTAYGVYVQGNANNLANDAIRDNYIHGIVSPSGQAYGVLADANVNNSTYGSLTGLKVAGNSIYDIGGSGTYNGFGVSTNEVVGQSVGAGLSVTGNTFANIHDGNTTVSPLLVGIAVSAGRTTGDNTYLENPTSGVLIKGNTYSNTTVGAFLDSTNSSFDEASGSFTAVPTFLINAGRFATVATADLNKYAVTNDPASLDQLEPAHGTTPGLGTLSDAYTAAIQTAITATGTTSNTSNPVGSFTAATPTVAVSAGTFTEQVTIPESLTVTGAGLANTIIQAPTSGDASGSGNVVSISGAGTVVDFGGFTVAGPAATGNTIVTGISVGGAASASIHDDATNGYLSNDILITGSNTSATVVRTTVTGVGSSSTFAQNGIQVSNGALGTIGMAGPTGSETANENQINNFLYSGTDGATSVGILLSSPAQGSTVEYNGENSNSVGIETTGNFAPTIIHNDINGNNGAGSGIISDFTGTATIDNNLIQAGSIAIQASSNSTSNTSDFADIEGNTVVGYNYTNVGIVNQSAGTATISGNNIYGGVGIGIDSNSPGTATLLRNTIGVNSNITTGIEVDQGTVFIGDGTDPNKNTIGGYARTGIVASGSGTTATINDNVITGVGSMSPNGSFGVFINGGAKGVVSGNTISNNQTSNTNSVGILLSGTAGGSSADGNTLDNNDIAVSVGSTGSTDVSNNLINTGSSSTGRYGIDTSSSGTTTINTNTIDATTVNGISSNATGTVTITSGTINDTANTYAGIEVDQGTVNATSITINGGQRGLYAASVNGPVTVTLAGTSGAPTTINGATTGIFIDSSRGGGASTVTVDANTFVTKSGADGAAFAGSMSSLSLAVAPQLTTTSPTYTDNADGTYNATFSFSGSDQITSANDLVYQYSLDGAAPVGASSPLTFSKLSQGTHTVMLTVMNQGTGANSSTTQTINLSEGISDGGFETPALGAGQFSYHTTGSPWTFMGGSGIASNGSAFTSGNPPAPGGGTQVAFLQQGDGTMGANGSYFMESATFQNPGTYTIGFDAAQRANFSQTGQNFEVLVDGNVVGTFTPSSASYQHLTTSSFAITTAGTHSVTFIGFNSVGGDNTAFIDNIAIASTPPPSIPVVADSGFETPPVGAGSFKYNPTGSPWTFTGSTGISGNNSGFTSGNEPAPEGAQVAILQGGDGLMDANGSYFSQVVNFGANGGSYVLTFDAAQRGNIGNQHQNFEILVDNTVVGTFTPSSATYQALSTAAFTVTGGTHTITFVGIDSAGGDNTAFIDNIAIATSVPSTAPAVPNGGFETPPIGAGSFRYNPANATWNFVGLSGISGNGSGFTSGNSSAPEGAQVAILQGGSGSFFSQAISFTTTGNYNLNFMDAQRGNVAGQQEDFTVMILDSNNVVVATKDFKPTSSTYQADVEAFNIAMAGMYTIEFVGLDTAGGDNTAFIDAVTITNA